MNEKEARSLRRLRQEAEFMEGLFHPNICTLLGVCETKTRFSLVLQYASRGDLLDLLNKKGALEENLTKYIFLQILDAVDYLHGQGIVHRDLKPENIFLAKHYKVLLGDFGLAAYWSRESQLTDLVGTLNYAAPEIIEQLPYNGPQVDVWGLGLLLLVMLTARLPFDGADDSAIVEKILALSYSRPSQASEEVKDLLSSLLTLDPEKRLTLAQIREHAWIKPQRSPEKKRRVENA